MKDSFTTKQDLTFKEFLSSTLYVFFVSRRLRLYALALTGLYAISTGLGFVTTAKKFNPSVIAGLPAMIIFLSTILALFICIMCLYLYRAKPYLFKNVSYDFTHWGVVRHGERTDFSKPWREITKIRESKNFFLFYAGMDAHIIPKRTFASQQELDEFRQFLNRTIDNRILK